MAVFLKVAYCRYYFPLVLSRTTTRGVINHHWWGVGY